MRTPLLLASFATITAVLGSPACVSIPSSGQAPVLATHVKDWRDEVIYQVIVDRFGDGDVNNDYTIQPGFLGRYQGGDWKGIQDHLDYLQALGITTLWISPVIVNVDTDAGIDGYHGYWATDLTKPNKHFGDLVALRSMVAAAHDVGMKVVLDIVCNHMGQVFFYDMNHNGQPDDYIEGSGGTDSPVTQVNEFDPDWNPLGVQGVSGNGPIGRAPVVFLHDPTIDREPPQPGILATAAAYHGMGHIVNFSDPQQVVYGDFTGGLKDLATENPDVQATLVDSYAKWVESVDFDGFRIDTIKHVQTDFWSVFAPNVRRRLAAEGKSNFIQFGEAFDGDDQLLGSYTQPGLLDSVFYFSQHYTVFQRVFEYAKQAGMQTGTDQIEQLWSQKTTNYGTAPQPGGIGLAPYKALVNFIDNHDVARFLYDAKGDTDALKNALTLLYTEEGIPDLYYGTEQNFSGGNDPANREVLWNTGFDTTNDTFTHIAKLARIRRTYLALRRGDTTVRWSSPHIATEQDAGIFAFERTGGDAGTSYALVVQNTNSSKASDAANGASQIVTALPTGTVLVDVLNGNAPGTNAPASFTTDATGSVRVTNVPAQSAYILIPQAQVQAGQ